MEAMPNRLQSKWLTSKMTRLILPAAKSREAERNTLISAPSTSRCHSSTCACGLNSCFKLSSRIEPTRAPNLVASAVSPPLGSFSPFTSASICFPPKQGCEVSIVTAVSVGASIAFKITADKRFTCKAACTELMHCGWGSMPMGLQPNAAANTVHIPSFIPESTNFAPTELHVERRMDTMASTINGSFVPTQRTILRAPARLGMSSFSGTSGARRYLAASWHRLAEKHGEAGSQSQRTHSR
mmetsp:Transcript_76532/g.127578  ORF Transcript_76532/g.127578 Transcript_76532/m.127578 type:complete len:241 (+) Transcript_76532:919-1641(+)